MLAAPNDDLYRRLVTELELPALAADPRFASNPERVANRAALRDELAPALLRDTADGWEERLRSRGIPYSRVRTVAELAVDSQLAALDLLQAIPGAAVPRLRLVGTPVAIDGVRGECRLPSRRPNSVSTPGEVLAELGLGADKTTLLYEQGVVVGPALDSADG